MARKSILVVDDEKSQREILEMILSGEGYDVTTASSGEAALKFAKERRIVRALVARCMGKLAKPGLVTTTTEEVLWIAEWCHRYRVPYRVGKRYYPTALVGDPICFIQIGKGH